jgi:SAM-dependent methyltransferase
VLELGCGAGANALHMKRDFEMVLVDLSEAMLRQCRRVNPDLEAHVGDLRSFRYPRRFDAVFVHDAASYMLTADDVRAAVQTAALHLQPGGVALLCPDDLAETFVPGSEHGGHDGADGRSLRYLDWSVAGPDDTVISDYVYMLREADGTLRVERDRHITGRLPTATWLDAIESAGLRGKAIALEHSEVAEDRHFVFVGVMPGSSRAS